MVDLLSLLAGVVVVVVATAGLCHSSGQRVVAWMSARSMPGC